MTTSTEMSRHRKPKRIAHGTTPETAKEDGASNSRLRQLKLSGGVFSKGL